MVELFEHIFLFRITNFISELIHSVFTIRYIYRLMTTYDKLHRNPLQLKRQRWRQYRKQVFVTHKLADSRFSHIFRSRIERSVIIAFECCPAEPIMAWSKESCDTWLLVSPHIFQRSCLRPKTNKNGKCDTAMWRAFATDELKPYYRRQDAQLAIWQNECVCCVLRSVDWWSQIGHQTHVYMRLCRCCSTTNTEINMYNTVACGVPMTQWPTKKKKMNGPTLNRFLFFSSRLFRNKSPVHTQQPQQQQTTTEINFFLFTFLHLFGGRIDAGTSFNII